MSEYIPFDNHDTGTRQVMMIERNRNPVEAYRAERQNNPRAIAEGIMDQDILEKECFIARKKSEAVIR